MRARSRRPRGGTLFLDEVGELTPELQMRLLRVLERREVKRVGAAHFRDVDVRVLAATQRDLGRAVQAGTFRSDLYYRLAVVKVTLPPLRHRVEDIPHLAREILERMRPGSSVGEVLSETLLGAFAAYPWPGNVRELRNTLERVVLLGDAALPKLELPAPIAYHEARRGAIDAFERDYCRRRLEESAGVMARAASRAGISRQMFHRLVRKHGLSTAE